MENTAQWWRRMARLKTHPPSGAEVLEDLKSLLDWPAPSISRWNGFVTVLARALGDRVGISLFVAGQPGQALWVAASHGVPGPPTVQWGEAVAGIAARERSGQLVEDIGALPEYPGAAAGIRQLVAVPIIRDGRVYGVLEARSEEVARLGMVEAEWVGRAAAQLAALWPAGWPESWS